MPPSGLKPQLPPGFQDMPEAEATRLFGMLERVLGVYRLYGYPLLETPVIEYADRLGLWLPDEARPLGGVFGWQAEGEESDLALRYDLTAPLARFAAQNHQSLPKPFRRAQWGYVFRNDKPGAGRMRQFMQVDADILGQPGTPALAELCQMTGEALLAAGLESNRFTLRLNDRRLLDALLTAIDADEAQLAGVLRAIDKFDRLGTEGVVALLGEGRKDESGDFTKGANLNPAQIEAVLAFLRLPASSRPEFLAAANQLPQLANAKTTLNELAELDALLNAATSTILFDPAIVRGLGYYRGLVFEAVLSDPPSGFPASIAAGGVYEGLLQRFDRQQTGMEQGAGMSIGLTRLAALLPLPQPAGAVVIAFMDAEGAKRGQAMAAELRREGIRAHLYPGRSGLKAQFKYADKSAAPFVILQGEDERAADEVMVKNMQVGLDASNKTASREGWREQKSGETRIPRADLVEFLRAHLQEQD